MRALVAMLLLGLSIEQAKAVDELVFAPKQIWSENDDSIVGVSGTLAGSGLGRPGNAHAIVCIKARKECWVTSIDQVGPNELGSLAFPHSYPIESWTGSRIVARQQIKDPGWECLRIVIVIDRTNFHVQWTEEPVDPANARCELVGDETRRFTIEDSPAWARRQREPNERMRRP